MSGRVRDGTKRLPTSCDSRIPPAVLSVRFAPRVEDSCIQKVHPGTITWYVSYTALLAPELACAERHISCRSKVDAQNLVAGPETSG